MKKLFIFFILITFSQSYFAFGLSVKEGALAKKVYRNNFKEFYKKVTLNIESHSKSGVLSYNGYQVQNDYMDMVDSIKKELNGKGIAVIVNPSSEEHWSGYNSFFYDDSAQLCKDIMKRRIKKDFLTVRQNTLNIIYPNLLKKGWSISRSGFAKGKLVDSYYKLPVLISVKLNMSTRSAMWGLSYEESINSRVYNLKSNYLVPSSDNLKLAEVKARDWDFAAADQYYLKELKENSHTLETKLIKAIINNEKLVKKDYDKNSQIFEKSNNAELIGKSIAILGGALVMEQSGLPREELTSLQALYAIDILTDNKNMSHLNSGLSEISKTNVAINEYKTQKRVQEKKAYEDAIKNKKQSKVTSVQEVVVQEKEAPVKENKVKKYKTTTNAKVVVYSGFGPTASTNNKESSLIKTKDSVTASSVSNESAKKSSEKEQQAFEFFEHFSPSDYLNKTDHALVATWKNKNNYWFSAGPTQRTLVGDETEEEALPYAYNDNVDTIKFIGTQGKYKLYTLGRKLKPGDLDIRKIIK